MTTFVSVHSFRGGTGKSNLTANVAALLAASGKRVAVVDTDIQSPGIHVLFGFDEEAEGTLNDFLWVPPTSRRWRMTSRRRSPPTCRWHRRGAVPGAVEHAGARHRPRCCATATTWPCSTTVSAISADLGLDVLLIDTHPGLNEETMLSLTISDVLLLMLRPDKQDFQGTAVTVDIARRLDVPRLLLVVNKVPHGVDRDDLVRAGGAGPTRRR